RLWVSRQRRSSSRTDSSCEGRCSVAQRALKIGNWKAIGKIAGSFNCRLVCCDPGRGRPCARDPVASPTGGASMTKEEMITGLAAGRRLIQEEWADGAEIAAIDELVEEGKARATAWQ